MSGPRTILAIDLGTQSLRVSALSTSGTRLWSWSRPVDSIIDGAVNEQDSRQWSELLHSGLIAAAAAGIVPDVIAACGPLAGFVALDADGVPLANAVMYNDGRAASETVEVERALGAGNTYPRVAAADPIPQWLRLRRESPELAARTRWFLDATGWLNFVLTGQATLNTFTALRLYAPGILSALDSASAPFGRRVALGEPIAPLSVALRARLGWQAVPVVAATFDSKCAYIAGGLSEARSGLDISGTVTSFGVLSRQEVTDPAKRVYSIPFGGAWLVRGSTAAAGSVLEWARGLLGITFEEFDSLVRSAPPGAGGVVLVPYHAGARAPLWRPQARGVMSGISLDTGRAEVARSVYEGLALSLRHIVETIESCGVAVREIRLSGGLSRNPTLSQIKADILGKPLVALADGELTTLGLAVIGSVALGAYPDHRTASAAFVADAKRFEPNASRAIVDDLYARYLAAIAAAAPTPFRGSPQMNRQDGSRTSIGRAGGDHGWDDGDASRHRQVRH